MSCLLEMPGWITYNGPTQDNWNLLWYRDRVLAVYAGENFTDFILRNEPMLPGNSTGQTGTLHPKSFSIDIRRLSSITFIRRRLFLLPNLLFEGEDKKVSFYTRDKGTAPLECFKRLRDLLPNGIDFVIR